MHDVTVIYDVLLALLLENAPPTCFSEATAIHEVLVSDHLSPDETPFQVCMYLASCFMGDGAANNLPRSNLVFADR